MDTEVSDEHSALELHIDLNKPVEVHELADILRAFSDQFDDFIEHEYASEKVDPKFFVQDIRRGSIVVDFAASAIGLMDQFIILKQFYEITKIQVGSILGGSTPSDITDRGKQHLVDMVRAVAASDDGKMTLGYRHIDQDGCEEILVISKSDSVEILDVLGKPSSVTIPAPEVKRINVGETKRCFMRIFQHNQDPNVADKARTGHKAIVQAIDPLPRVLRYDSEEVADALSDIVQNNAYPELLFDVTVEQLLEGTKLKGYRLVTIHGWARDDDADDQVKLL